MNNYHLPQVMKKALLQFICIVSLFSYSANKGFAQINISTTVGNLKVCGDDTNPALVTVTIQNQSPTSTYTISGASITTDLLYDAVSPSGTDGLTASGTSAAVLVAAGGGSSNAIGVTPALPNTSAFKFSLSDFVFSPNQKVILTFYVKSDCGIFSSGANSLRTSYSTLTYSGSVVNENSGTTYSLIFPVFQLDKVQGADVSNIVYGNIGDQLTRKLKVTNALNAGSVDNFQIKVLYKNIALTAPVELKLTNGTFSSTLTATTESPVTTANGKMYIYKVGLTELNNLQLGNSFSSMQSFTIEEKINILTCPSTTPSDNRTDYFVEWGCGSPAVVCNPNSVTQLVYIQKQTAAPNLGTTLTQLAKGDVCTTNAGNPAKVRIEIKNNGTVSRDKAINIIPYLTFSGLAISKLSVISAGAGSAILLSSIAAPGGAITLGSIPSGYGLEDLDGDGAFDDLALGKSLILEAEYAFTSCSLLPSCNNISRQLSASASYTAICETALLSTSAATIKDEITNNGSASTDGPTDMVANGNSVTFSFSAHAKAAAYQLMNAPTSTVTAVYLTLPANYQLATNANAKFIDGQTQTGSSLTFTQNGQIVTFFGGGMDGTYNVDLKLVCPSSAVSDDFSKVHWELQLQNTWGGTCSCNYSLACADLEVYNHFSAYCTYGTGGGSGTACTIRTQSMLAERVSYGYTQASPNNTTGVWIDGNISGSTVSANATTAGINKKAAYECDVIQVTVTGTITNTCTTNFTRNDVHVRVTYRPLAPTNDATNKFINIVSGTSTFDIAGTNAITAAEPTVAYDALNNVWYFDFVLGGTAIVPSGTVVLHTKFSVLKNDLIPLAQRIARFRGQHYTGTTTVNTIESWGETFNVYRPTAIVTESNSGSPSGYLCDMKRELRLSVKGGSGADDFPNEFRSFGHLNTISYQLPKNYEYNPGTSVMKVLAGGSSASIALIDPVKTGSLANGYTLNWTRGTNWPVLDVQAASNDMWLEFTLAPSCATVEGGNFAATVNHTKHDYSTTCSDPSISVPVINTPDPRLQPHIVISSLDQVVLDNIVYLPVTISNTGNIAPNAWVAIEPPSNITINGLYTYDNNTGAYSPNTVDVAQPYGASGNSLWVKMNAFSGNKLYYVKATLNTCVVNSPYLINVYSGWDCNSFPTFTGYPSFTAANLGCGVVAKGTVKITPILPILYVSNLSFEPAKDICSATSFTVSITSQAGGSSIHDIKGTLTLPNGVSLLNVKGRLNNQGVYGNQITLIPVSGTSNVWNISSQILTSETKGLQTNQALELVFALQPSCSFNPYDLATLFVDATSSCGDHLPSQFPKGRIPILGFEGGVLDAISTTIVANDFVTWDTPSQVILTTTNSLLTSNPSNVKVVAHLPANVEYVSNTGIVYSSKISTSTGTDITFIYPPASIAASQSNVVTITIKQVCATDVDKTTSASVITSITQISNCSTAPGGTCNVEAKSGTRSDDMILKFAPPVIIQCSNCIGSFHPVPDEKYIISAWVHQSNGISLNTFTNANISLNFTGGGALGPFYAKGVIIDGWQRIDEIFSVPVGASEIFVKLNNTGGSDDVFFDDLRILPIKASLKSFVYDPISMRLMAELDENNYATFYEYDEEGALIRVKKETERGVKTIKESGNNTKK